VDDLLFVGHPATVPAAASAVRTGPDQLRPVGVTGSGGSAGGSTLAELLDPTLGLPEYLAQGTLGEPRRDGLDNGAPTISLFHVALVMPAGTPDALLQRYYEEVLQPLTAILRHEQLRCNYVGRESETIQAIHEVVADTFRVGTTGGGGGGGGAGGGASTTTTPTAAAALGSTVDLPAAPGADGWYSDITEARTGTAHPRRTTREALGSSCAKVVGLILSNRTSH